jgi:diaminopimelate epimerase
MLKFACMPIIPFSKYQGTGNDFILIDQSREVYITPEQQKLIEKLCDRRFGIGADGLMLLEPSSRADFKMVYFNSDGLQSSMCGNGGRCIVRFARFKGLIDDQCSFEAVDGMHTGRILSETENLVELGMNEVQNVKQVGDESFELNTGSPHYVRFVHELPEHIEAAGRAVRYSEQYKKEGINVNFVKMLADGIHVSTYERGVEAETLSCGTGVTAAALASHMIPPYLQPPVNIYTKGGILKVDFEKSGDKFFNIKLTGSAIKVFDGYIDTDSLS